MKTISAFIAAIIVLALITREFNWKARALFLGTIIVMLIVLAR